MADQRIQLIHTGGTIGMVRSESGFTPQKGVVEAEIGQLCQDVFPGLEVSIDAFHPLIDSANATPEDWNRITGTILQTYEMCDAVLITHGTDTLAYTAAALTLSLQGLTKPVILTGSMLPLTEPGNDGAQNLRDAVATALSSPAGVYVQFARRLLHGGRIRKTHSNAFDAFAAEATNMPPLRAGSELCRYAFGQHDIAVLPVVPGGSASVLPHAAETCDGLVLRCFGSGTVPNTASLVQALKTAEARKIPVVAVSQCPEGGIALGTYAAGAVLAEHHVVDGRDMTVEAAFVKLTLALSHAGGIEEMRRFLATPVCGEFVA